MSTKTKPIVMISADCHAGPPAETYREYLDPGVHTEYDAWLAGVEEQRRQRQSLFEKKFFDDFESDEKGLRGAWDPEQRVRELEGDGTVAEVIYPDSIVAGGVPFGAGIGMNSKPIDPKLTLAGARAHNRWLKDLCDAHPGRRAGIAAIPIDDIDIAVEEIHWAREALPQGGILLPAGTGELPLYFDPRYEPIWETCADLALPVSFHTGSGPPDYGNFPFSPMLYVAEGPWFAHRPLTFLMWSGVFERHPNLTVVMAEQGSAWVVPTLAGWDSSYQRPMFKHLIAGLPLKPSEYFARQVFVAASMLSPEECRIRHKIGVDKLMWGSDYPHPEGTWPNTKQKLHETFSDVPEAEARAMLGDTAAAVYRFDTAALAADAARVGPLPGEL
ncbi:MAG: amidohydrolase [Myxococcales bacterium]|nr:amidohydrolase [Myxococcales bacterium]